MNTWRKHSFPMFTNPFLPFTFEFMQRALFAGIIIGILCAIIGVFLVLRRQSLLGDGLSHITFGGVALGLFLHWQPIITALVCSILSAFAIQKLQTKFKLYGETAVAILFSLGLGLGVILISTGKGANVNIIGVLFGSILAIDTIDVVIIGFLGLAVPLSIFLLYKELLYITFDEQGARASGLPVETLDIFFIILTAITVVLSIKIVGILLVSSLLVLPCAASMQICKSFKQTIIGSIFAAVVSVVLGLLAAYWFNIAPGGSIVMISILLFVASLLIGKMTIKSTNLRRQKGKERVM